MLNMNELVDLLERYERFLIYYAVAVFRLLGDVHPSVEMKLLGIIKGNVFPVPMEAFSKHLERLSDPDLRRRKVAEALVERFQLHKEIIEFLTHEISEEIALKWLIESMHKGETFDRGFSMATLAIHGNPAAREAILNDLPGMPRPLRWGILAILVHTQDPQWMPLLVARLEDSDSDVVCVAIPAVSRGETAFASSKLQELLGHTSEPVVVAAIQTLAQMKDKSSVEILKNLFRTTKSSKVRATIVSAFGKFRDPSTVGVLAECLTNTDPRTRANAVLSLKCYFLESHNQPGGIIAMMKCLLIDDDNRVRADAFQALWELGCLDSSMVIEDLMKSRQETDRSSGAYLCGKLKLDNFKDKLIALTDDSAWNVRKTASLALLGFRDSGLEILKTLMANGTPDQQVCAAFAAGLADDPAGVDLLLARSRSESEMSEMATDLLLRLSTPCEGKQ